MKSRLAFDSDCDFEGRIVESLSAKLTGNNRLHTLIVHKGVRNLGHAARVRLDVPEVARMVLRRVRASMFRARWIEMRTGAGQIGCAQIAFLVDVKPMLGVGRETDDLADNQQLVAFHFRERQHAGDILHGRLCRGGR